MARYKISPYRDLVDAYLRFVLVHPKPRYVWGQLNAAYESSAAQFTDSWALTLSVVVESFVNNEFAEMGKPSDEVKALVDEAKQYIDGNPAWSDEFKKRLKGTIGGMKNTRIGDRLLILADKGAIEPTASQRWSRIRNGTAHNYQGQKQQLNQFQEDLDSLETLFYHVFFHAIGYSGPSTDYSALGYPTKSYPLQQTPDEPSQ